MNIGTELKIDQTGRGREDGIEWEEEKGKRKNRRGERGNIDLKRMRREEYSIIDNNNSIITRITTHQLKT
jgi:hypothetical protein